MDLDVRPGKTTATSVVTLSDGKAKTTVDDVATEEPMEIRLQAGSEKATVAVTMRTPGNDFELAAGFLYNEGIITSRDAIRGIAYCVDRDVDDEQRYNIVTVTLSNSKLPEVDRFERHFTMSSACGICGRASLEALRDRGIQPIEDDLQVDVQTIYALPERMREAQRVFASTGGLHAAALFDERGDLIVLREDVGRHNALDKLVGWGLLENRLPLSRSIVLVSGRASYELLQKSASAGIPIVCAISAPSSLAIQTAREFGITLVGFLRGTRLNTYTGVERISGTA
ncbi:MAG: formate dehydrogenase accessory sulfurtransferase FdhD [Vulcanimicrobiaceae bacterium]